MPLDHPLSGMFEPLTPEQVDRAVALRRKRYRAPASADLRRIRREARMGAVRAWIRWILHI